MSDDIVVVDGGEVYETQESSIIAKDEADRAEKWGKLAEERADIATSASFEAIKSKDEAAQYAATTKSNRDYVNSLLNSSGFKAVANDMLATPSAIKTALQNANNAAADAENAAESATLANDSAGDAAHWADDSRIWAVGSDTEVNQLAPNQGKHSSKTYADLAGNEADRAQQEADRAKQYVDMGELADKITNCITEIPQDIKLELNNGTLTLKAGSKVYVPNGKNADGSNKFDCVTVASDLIVSASTTQSNLKQYMVCLAIDNSGAQGITRIYHWESGNGSSYSYSWEIYYNTVTNKAYIVDGNVARTEYILSLPIALVTADNVNIWTSIDQVFNGFGYIGSTVYALPGVKGLIPNGRNADGSLRNIEQSTKTVMTWTVESTTNYQQAGVWVNFDDNGWYLSNNYYEGDVVPTGVATHTLWYNPRDNLVKTTNNGGSSWIAKQYVRVGVISTTQTTINSVSFSKAFKAVDYSDSSWVAQQAFPSNKYIDLTFGASGTKYTAPANGWFVVRKRTAAANQGLFFGISNGVQFENYNPVSGAVIGLAVPAKRGDVLNTSYSAGGTTEMFRFIYAEGDK